tara:strand:+ start:101 stop:685 length:585 start_codon:yes stop_codon:yes gene_type:complete
MACSRFSVSHSTISRLVKKVKTTDNLYKGEKILTHTTLNNKVKKTLILSVYLESVYTNEVDKEHDDIYQDNRPNTESRLLDIMDRQLTEKDKQIENLQYLLLQSQKRLQVFDEMLKLGSDKKKDIIIDEVDDTHSETPITNSVEIDEVDGEVYSEVEVVEEQDEMVLVEVDEEELKMEEKRLSFLSHIRRVGKD